MPSQPFVPYVEFKDSGGPRSGRWTLWRELRRVEHVRIDLGTGQSRRGVGYGVMKSSSK